MRLEAAAQVDVLAPVDSGLTDWAGALPPVALGVWAVALDRRAGGEQGDQEPPHRFFTCRSPSPSSVFPWLVTTSAVSLYTVPLVPPATRAWA